MRHLWFFLLLAEILAPAASGAAAGSRTVHPAVKIISVYEKLPAGGEVSISPYITDLYAIDLVSKKEMLRDVGRYIEWHFKNLNYPDRFGLTGTIYDFEIDPDGAERRLKTYDSADSYAATFLILLRDYLAATGNSSLIRKNKARILDIAYIMATLQDSDGLTWALKGHDEKYLMDNCEVAAGLSAAIDLIRTFGWKKERYYENVRSGVVRGISAVLWDEENRNFSWAVGPHGPSRSSWERLYPDALAQLFPIVWSVPGVSPELKKSLYESFNLHQSGAIASAPPEQRLLYGIAGRKAANP